MTKKISLILLVVLCLLAPDTAEARRRKNRQARRPKGPPPTHPMVLWAKTLNESQDREQRRVAAYKLSQYSVNIVHSQVVDAIVRCSADDDTEIKVLCTKALGHSGPMANAEPVRKVLIDRYKKDPALKDTVVRTFIARKDISPAVQDIFFEELTKTGTSLDHRMVLLSYFEQFGIGNDKLVNHLSEVYHKEENIRLRRAVAKVLAAKAQGQDSVIGLFAQCSESKDTPLALTCLDGLKSQAKKDNRVWGAVEKSILSTDPDVLIATLDVINALPENTSATISTRLLEIIKDSEDPDIQEKATLALGIAGDHSEMVVAGLLKLIDDKETEDSVRIASVLVLGRQAVVVSERTTELLEKCLKENNTQALKTACQLATKELDSRKKSAAAKEEKAEKAPATIDPPATQKAQAKDPEEDKATN